MGTSRGLCQPRGLLEGPRPASPASRLSRALPALCSKGWPRGLRPSQSCLEKKKTEFIGRGRGSPRARPGPGSGHVTGYLSPLCWPRPPRVWWCLGQAGPTRWGGPSSRSPGQTLPPSCHLAPAEGTSCPRWGHTPQPDPGRASPSASGCLGLSWPPLPFPSPLSPPCVAQACATRPPLGRAGRAGAGRPLQTRVSRKG